MTNAFYIFTMLVLALSCQSNHKNPIEIETDRSVHPSFQEILDSADVVGSILIYDPINHSYHSNDFEWASNGQLPASTFKIVNSIIALETGVVEHDSTLLKWNGDPRRMEIWEQDLVFRDAFHLSCVPCYQTIATQIGSQRMNSYLDQLDFGVMQVTDENIDLFWLEGDSKVTQFEQIHFLNRFRNSELPINTATQRIMERLMVMEENEDFKISGKTGWSIRNGNNNGWFVGQIEFDNQILLFATNIEPRETFDMTLFPIIRKDITYRALKAMGAPL